ncbi:MAG: transcriptional regulator [Candidatus Diapherotrites archaeon CG_4_10_14_0_2_um_filter_31_5]|nr:MAG: transcriptional regulator [Candidatus Diapherotrites archaeon CG_4_10_14_0_2_um_filter_31_5]
MDDQALNLDSRRKLYDLIEENPGLHFRELERRTGLAVGSLQYHLEFLQKKHLIKTFRQGKFLRYYSVKESVVKEKAVMSFLRKESARKIILFLLEKKKANNLRISKAVSLSPSTTSWHLDQLVKEEVLGKEKRGRESLFFVVKPSEVASLLIEHKGSFVDDLVDSFVEVWQEI